MALDGAEAAAAKCEDRLARWITYEPVVVDIVLVGADDELSELDSNRTGSIGKKNEVKSLKIEVTMFVTDRRDAAGFVFSPSGFVVGSDPANY